jgi:ribonucleoside-diphosphate reductase alpha chain
MTDSAALSRLIWDARYRAEGEVDIAATQRRVATALAAVEPSDQARHAAAFAAILKDFAFLPGGRILAGAGTGRDVTLLNCFVMGLVADSIPGIFRALEEAARTMHQGGGIGADFSTLRPAGTPARATGTIASGPVSFLAVWDAMCATLLSTGARRGAMMATLRCDHPDIAAFIAAKREPGRLANFNLSVQVTDDFIAAVRAGADWPLVFPAAAIPGQGETVTRAWPGHKTPVECRILARVSARALWQDLLRAAYDRGEPGVLFIDRINRLNPLAWREHISATNPCGEIPLPPNGACDLGAINLARLIREPFTPRARLDRDRLLALIPPAVRLLDNVLDATRYPLPQQRAETLATRRIGLGITGLADALLMLGLPYDSAAARLFAEDTMRAIRLAAIAASIALAEEKSPFPAFASGPYLAAPTIAALPASLRDGIARHGIRNSHLTAIAPTGSISLLAGNLSPGIEPIFAAEQRRAIRDRDGTPRTHHLTDFAVAAWRQAGHTGTPPSFVPATALPIAAHIGLLAALAPHVDNAISKTINVAPDCPFADFAQVFDAAYDAGLKGCTAFRPRPETGAVLAPVDPAPPSPPHCPGPSCARD